MRYKELTITRRSCSVKSVVQALQKHHSRSLQRLDFEVQVVSPAAATRSRVSVRVTVPCVVIYSSTVAQ